MPHGGWGGVLEASQYGAIAPQNLGVQAVTFGAHQPVQSEDCLTLNVFTPGCDGGQRPVMVWIHGGAYLNGAGGTEWYDGSNFAANGDVVVVSINYRIGALGFAYLGGLGGEQFAGTGNLGVLDQAAALRWVSENITGFGGDPGNVTIFGESAGGGSVMSLLCLREANGLFQRAIAQSPSFGQFRTASRASEATLQLLDALGMAPDSVAELQRTPVEQIMAAQTIVERYADWGTAFSPTPDGLIFEAPIGELLATGRYSAVPLLIGTTLDEARLFTAFDPANAALDEPGVVRVATSEIGSAAALRVARAYREADPTLTWGQVSSALLTEHGFRLPSIATAEAWNSSVWMYRFDWRTPVFGGVLGACHSLEIPFVFGNLGASGVEMLTGTGADRQALTNSMHADWLTFCRGGDLPWATYDDANRTTRIYGGTVDTINDPDGDLRRLWAEPVNR